MTSAAENFAAGFRLGACSVFPNRNVVTRGHETVSLEPKIMDVFCLLVAHHGEVVSRELLNEQIWCGKFGSDESLTRAIYILRKALGHLSGLAAPIETVSKRGYRLAIPAVPLDPAGVAPDGRTATPQAARPSIAVLAFDDMSPRGDQEHFSDGIAEEIINALVPLGGIRVAGRTSSFSFKGEAKAISEIGAALGVDYILEGSVRMQGEQLRITVQLVEVRSDAHLWSHTYHGTIDSVFDLQEEIAHSVCAEMKVILHIENSRPRLVPALTADREAYALFLQGRALRARIFGDGALQQAADFFRQATTIDPGFAEAWAELGYAYAQIAGYVPQQDRRAILEQSFVAAQTAIDFKPDYGLAWMVQSWTPLTRADIVETMRLSEHALGLDPDNPEIVVRMGYYLLLIGRVQDALPLLRDAVELDPIQGRNHMILSLALLADGDIAAASHHAELALGLQYHVASMPAMLAAQAAGNVDLAVERLVHGAATSAASTLMSEMATPAIWQILGTIICAGSADQRAALVAQMTAMVEEPARRREMAYLLVLAGCGIAPAFFEAFGDRAEPGNHLILSVLWGPFGPYNALRSHNEFPEFADRIGLTAAWNVYGMPDCWSSQSAAA